MLESTIRHTKTCYISFENHFARQTEQGQRVGDSWLATSLARSFGVRSSGLASHHKVPSTFWAFCQVADISRLEELIHLANSIEDSRALKLFILEPVIKTCDSIIDRWLQILVGPSPPPPRPAQITPSALMQLVVIKRDDNNCILTGMGVTEAAHIYPLCLLRASTREPRAVGRFWDMLYTFWEESRVDKWKTEDFGAEHKQQTPRDGYFNMTSLEKFAHALWGAGRFALRPMETSDSTLKFQFHWQRRSSNGVTELDLLTQPEPSHGLYGGKDYSLPMLTGTFRESGEPEYRAITSGDVFTITTPDPRKLPLPSWSLLELQWNLQRITGMSGAGELGDYDDHDPDSMAPCVTAVRRTASVYRWLGVLPESEEEFERVQQIANQVCSPWAP